VQFFEVGVVYAVWSGAGIAVVALLGIVWFGESRSPVKLLSIALIIIGVLLLHASTLQTQAA
jgi:small multidrug resistance pump